MTLKQKLQALRIIEEIHVSKHSTSDIFMSPTRECGCAFGIVWRMINESPINQKSPKADRSVAAANRRIAKAWSV